MPFVPSLALRFRPAAGALLALLLTLAGASEATAKIRIVASTNDLGSIAASVGGDLVEVVSICRANADAHRVEVLPSYMVRVARADLYLKVGLGLDVWADQIVDGSHSSKVTIIDCSRGVTVIEKPTGKVEASMGDVHPDGNPHYWLDPANGAVVGGTIASALSKIDPSHAGDFEAAAERFARSAREMGAKGRNLGLEGRGLITYHRSWSYLANALGLEVLATIEPVPGIPPTARHLDEVVGVIRKQKPLVVLQEPYFSREAGKFLARETGIRVVMVSPSCRDVAPGSYLAHFEELFETLQSGGTSGNDVGR